MTAARPPLTAGLDDRAADRAARAVHEFGAAHVAQALTLAGRRGLLEAARAASFTVAQPQIGNVRQDAHIAVLASPAFADGPLHRLGRELAAWLRAAPWVGAGVHGFDADEATFMRYPARRGGISPHLDARCYRLLIAVFSLSGNGRLLISADRAAGNVLGHFDCRPGDLVLLRAPGFAGCPDGRPLHTAAASTDRLSLTLRMGAPVVRAGAEGAGALA